MVWMEIGTEGVKLVLEQIGCHSSRLFLPRTLFQSFEYDGQNDLCINLLYDCLCKALELCLPKSTKRGSANIISLEWNPAQRQLIIGHSDEAIHHRSTFHLATLSSVGDERMDIQFEDFQVKLLARAVFWESWITDFPKISEGTSCLLQFYPIDANGQASAALIINNESFDCQVTRYRFTLDEHSNRFKARQVRLQRLRRVPHPPPLGSGNHLPSPKIHSNFAKN